VGVIPTRLEKANSLKLSWINESQSFVMKAGSFFIPESAGAIYIY